MAKLTALPELTIIDGFKGVIDFYVNYQSKDPETRGVGIPCARKWPRSPGPRRAPAVEAQWLAFTWAAASWNKLSPEVQQAYRDTASEMTMSGRDLFVKAFISDYFREGQWEVPPPVLEYLDDLLDVSVPAPADDHILYWDAAANLWKAK